MLEGKALDQFMDRFFGDSCAQSLPGEEESGQELEEYELKEDGIIIQPIHKGKIEKRTWIGLIMFLAFVPLVLFILVHKFHGKHDVVISLLILAYATIPFFMVFEGRHPQAREIMVIAVMAALGVAGRSAFFMIGSFKPIAAIVIITGVSLGGEAGFLCACLIMMISNMFFGQGPWTPWQMFSYGMIGYLAGILFQKGILKARKVDLCIYGFLSVFLIFGGIMNPASILMAYGYITKKSLIAFYISGAPVDLVQATSTVIFLWILSRPLLEKLERVKRKYGLLQRPENRRKMNMTKNKLWQAIKGLTLAAGMAVGIFALGQTDVLADTLTLTVEKNTIGQGMILDPVQVEFAKGETCADVLLRGLSENGITPLYDTNTSYGFYLRGIANCDSGSLNPPACIQKVLSETSTWTGDAYKLTDNKYAPDLTEFSYCSASGWTYTLDNVFMGVGMGASHPSDGSVLRVMFALCGGTDITGCDPYNNNRQIFEAADKSELIRMMGKANAERSRWSQVSGFSGAYAEADSALTTLDASANRVYEAVQLLKSIESKLPVAPKLISLNASDLTLTKGDSYTLTYTIVPSDAVGTVSWTSSNNSVASVNGGVVTAVGEGSAVITARVSGSVYATCNISVSSRPVSVTGVSISPSSLNLSTKSGSRTLDYTITPNGAKPSSLYWESSNSSVVTVDGSGKVTPVGAGSADITLTTDNGTKGTCHVTVTAPAQSIALSDKTLTLAIDQGTYTLTWTFSPKGSGGELVWTSDNAGVAKVDQKGVITPVSVGETDIRVKTDQNVTAVCHVVVKGTAKDLFAAGMPEITTCKAAGNTVLLTWNKYENADSYIILRRKMGESKFAKIATVKDLSYTDTAVSPSTPYYYSVQAVSTKWGGAIKSSYDKNFSVTTNGIAPTPTPAQTVKPKTPAVTVTAGKKQATLKWKKVSGAKGYVVYRATSKSGKYKAVSTIKKGSTVSYINKKLTSKKTYYYKVRAYRTENGKRIYSSYSKAKSAKIK